MFRTLVSQKLAISVLIAGTALPLRAIPRPHRGGGGSSREQIISIENQWRQAQIAGDVSGMEKLLADDYIGITMSGQVVTKSQQLERMRSRQLMVTRFETSDVKVKLIGEGQVAIVNSLAQVEGNADGHPINGSFRYTRVYQKLSNGLWKITSFEATRIPGEPRSRTVARNP